MIIKVDSEMHKRVLNATRACRDGRAALVCKASHDKGIRSRLKAGGGGMGAWKKLWKDLYVLRGVCILFLGRLRSSARGAKKFAKELHKHSPNGEQKTTLPSVRARDVPNKSFANTDLRAIARA